MQRWVDHIPAGLVKLFARPYVAGDSLRGAIEVAAAELTNHGHRTTLDLLAEDISNTDQIAQNLAVYHQMIAACADDDRFAVHQDRPTISLKLSSYTTAPLDQGGDGAGCREAVFDLAAQAGERNVRLTVDMEGSPWTDFTLDLLRDLHRQGHRHVGAVLQSRLRRTDRDLETLPPECNLRMVVGIYDEPAEASVVGNRQVKERLVAQAQRALERGHYVEFASHDEPYVREFVDWASSTPDRFEVQMLYGVPRQKLLAELRAAGITTRLYVPFAIGWPMAIAYLRRRLHENPAVGAMVVRNIFGQ